MKNYSSKAKLNFSRTNRYSLVRRVLIGCCVILVLVSVQRIVGSALSYVTAPLLSVRHYFDTSTSALPAFVRDRNALLAEINGLQQELENQKGTQDVLAAIDRENEELRALLGATDASTILAGVIARPPMSPYDTVVIDKGASDGIVIGAPVYYGAGMVLGYVQSAYAHHSIITLFSSPDVTTTVYVFGPNIFTTARGEGGGVVRLSVPQGIHVAEGDVAVLPSITRGVLGTVYSVESVSTEPDQHAFVTLDVPLQSLRVVRVGTEPQVPKTFDEALATLTDTERFLFTVPVNQITATTTAPTTTTETSSIPEE